MAVSCLQPLLDSLLPLYIISQAFNTEGTSGLCYPQASTSLSSPSISTGSSVYDTADLFNLTSSAGGTVTYFFSKADSCPSSGATKVGSVTVTDGVVPNSPSHTFGAAGTYYWYAVYSGDSNNNGVDSSCEQLNVNTPGGGSGGGCPLGCHPLVPRRPSLQPVEHRPGCPVTTVASVFFVSRGLTPVCTPGPIA